MCVRIQIAGPIDPALSISSCGIPMKNCRITTRLNALIITSRINAAYVFKSPSCFTTR